MRVRKRTESAAAAVGPCPEGRAIIASGGSKFLTGQWFIVHAAECGRCTRSVSVSLQKLEAAA